MQSPALCAGFFFRVYCVLGAINSAVAAISSMDARDVGICEEGISLAKPRIKALPRATIVRENPGAHPCIGS